MLGGYEDNTFRPNGEVTYGEALKMIMKAAGYADQAPTDKHWASGYLARAQADGLLPAGTVGLDRKISRQGAEAAHLRPHGVAFQRHEHDRDKRALRACPL